MSQPPSTSPKLPEILAPAGDIPSFLAALSAGADAIYLGLKNFSARMEAENFNLLELSRLCDLAHAEKAKVYVTLNTMLKSNECEQCYRLLTRLEEQVHCDGLIIQDLALIALAKKAQFKGGIFLSTLANVTQKEGLDLAAKLGCDRVILPRELSIDEIKSLAENCPDNLDLELFVHGALCYCVSGRCYWSSYLGGKSGLRGRCVQPCRRLYQTGKFLETEEKVSKGQSARFFSCQDLSLDVLAQTLLKIPHLHTWKIEGRKKGPHYVYHTVKAYRLLRDAPKDPKVKEEALELLDLALGRPRTHARFLPQRIRIPTDPSGITNSGLVIGTIKRTASICEFKPNLALKAQDYLRIGNEEDRSHQTLRISRFMPKGQIQKLSLKPPLPPTGTLVFLLDRREPEMVKLLRIYQAKLKGLKGRETKPVNSKLSYPNVEKCKRRADMKVLAKIPTGKENRASSRQMLSLWISPKTVEISRPVARRVYWWLAPVTWPDETHKTSQLVAKLWQSGCRHFVLNSPWQRGFFPEKLPEGADLVAGPFCNLANPWALKILQDLGFKAAFVSPELSQEDLAKLPKISPLPLGLVLKGFWPVGISRFGLLALKSNTPFASPKGEIFWARDYGQNTWIYPAWPLDLSEKQAELEAFGYSFFAQLIENPPSNLPEAKRPGLFNYEGKLL
ncbi:MAG: U32 family peptidase [Desulfovibrionaceae bacterium]|nr:U32 family peptidase [Desulfovibrionaceae bacterium]